MSNVLDKSFIHRSYPKLAYGSIYRLTLHVNVPMYFLALHDYRPLLNSPYFYLFFKKLFLYWKLFWISPRVKKITLFVTLASRIFKYLFIFLIRHLVENFYFFFSLTFIVDFGSFLAVKFAANWILQDLRP